MASISTSNSFSVNKYSNKGMSGLASGMDTEGLVEQMLSGTQSKIDKQTGIKQQLLWKQEIYRELINDINSFRDLFFNLDSSTNFLSSSFFDSMTATSSSNSFKVTGTSSAAAGNTSVIVKQLATSAKMTSGSAVSRNGIVSKSNVDMLTNQTVVFEAGGKEVKVDLRALGLSGAEADKEADYEKIKDALNKAFEDAGVEGVTVDVNEKGALSFKGKDIWVSGKSDQMGLSMLGLSSGINIPSKGGTSQVNLDPEMQMEIALDGRSIKFGLKASDLKTMDANGLAEALNKKLEQFGKTNGGEWMVRVQADGNGNLNWNLTGAGHQLQIAGDEAALELTGVPNYQSSKISLSTPLKDVMFQNDLQGGSFIFEINGKTFAFDENASLSSIMKEVNNSGIGVRMTYSSLDDKFVLESTISGAGQNVQVKDVSGNLMNSMFGVKSGSSVISKTLGSQTMAGGETASVGKIDPGSFKFEVNGTSYTLSLAEKEGGYTQGEAIKELNRQLERYFGFTETDAGKEATISIDTADGKFRLNVLDGSEISFEGQESDLAEKFGFSGTNRVSSETTLSDVGLSDLAKIAGLGANATLGDLESVFGEGKGFVWDETSGRLMMDTDGLIALNNAVNNGTATLDEVHALAEKLFGTSDIGLGVKGTAADVVEGQNAVVTINGVETERSSNNFNVNGLDFQLKDVHSAYKNAQKGFVDNAGNAVASIVDGKTAYAAGVKEDGGVQYLVDANGSFLTDSAGNKMAYNAGTMTEAMIDPDGKVIKDSDIIADTVTTERDTEKVFDAVKDFVEKYNELVGKLNKYIRQDANYKKYDPLTSAQKKEMSDREIELWEEKAKEGLLRNDMYIESFLSDMRLALFQKPDGSNYALYDLGIDTISGIGKKEDSGKLSFDASKLRQALANDPDSVRELFTNATDGLAANLNNAIKKAANLSSASPGSLVSMAGMSGYGSDKNNTIYRQIQEIENKIKDLNAKYEREKERYWNQFNAMEKYIAQMNSQSSWLAQQLGGY